MILKKESGKPFAQALHRTEMEEVHHCLRVQVTVMAWSVVAMSLLLCSAFFTNSAQTL
jgi:hypothetical protein